MKTVIVILLAVAGAVAIPFIEYRRSGEGGWYVPQPDGSFQWVTANEAEKLHKESTGRMTPNSIYKLPTSVYFHLYTSDNPTTADALAIGDVKALKKSHFHKNYTTKFIIHGWQSHSNSDTTTAIRDAYLSNGNFNIFTVDWSDKAQSFNYTESWNSVPDVGKQVASFIDFVYKKGGLSFDTLHLIGHSLGAHIAGFTGKNVKYGRISHITGLDPASPLFSYDKPATRLHKDDADYVESIQTSGGLLGFLEPIGEAAFYPNGGMIQPGCGLDVFGECAHGRSWQYYVEAVTNNNFPSIKCENYENIVQNSCGKTFSSVRMAAPSNFLNVYGDFYVPVNKKAPYGKGQ